MATIKLSEELELLLSQNVFGNQRIGIIPNIYVSRRLRNFGLIWAIPDQNEIFKNEISSAVIVCVGAIFHYSFNFSDRANSRPWGFLNPAVGFVVGQVRGKTLPNILSVQPAAVSEGQSDFLA